MNFERKRGFLVLANYLYLTVHVFCLFQSLKNLEADNARLKEENGALIRVISKLSK